MMAEDGLDISEAHLPGNLTEHAHRPRVKRHFALVGDFRQK
jgi:hypothetical protein